MNENHCIADDLRALKALAVKQCLFRSRYRQSALEILCAVSPDGAIKMLRNEQYCDVRLMQFVAQADKAMRVLAGQVDWDGSLEEQVKEDPWFHEKEQEYEEALGFLGRLAKSENGNLTPEDEERKTAALDTLSPITCLKAADRRPVTDDEANTALNTLQRMVEFD